ncbi:YxD-tail cyclophane-containing RiPP peptide [Streptomyces sp. GQFP]|uniref:YxD-tail cyclophane-containing RiPP peptide n=1 Tax=Streptomyces sp. GQFP TaxID=2907545 RepID=UPI001F1A0345|nr:YxD-tail cyclophane-containing RiPP peptide [Streptomyces sp. GQFP]UIX30077.1 hypothetical protein LUX31_08550 [Streptomyces sp. GQFP]
MSNCATDEPTAWDEPLPDLTGVEWGDLRGSDGHSVLNEVLAMLMERTTTVAFYDDAP